MLANGNDTITVQHYKDAAQRHYRTCAVLVKQLDFPQNFRERDKWNDLLANIYYLTGYMSECGLVYQYFRTIGLNDSADYYPNRRSGDININQHFCFTKNHISCKAILASLSGFSLPNYLKELQGVTGLTLSISEQRIKDMQSKWDPKVRYSYESTGLLFNTTTSKDEIVAFYRANQKLLKILGII
jgi:hypothetical protein